MNGNMTLGKRVTALEKNGGDNAKIKDIEKRLDLLENDISAISSYSTEETVVGNWIDNKPIYQKTIELGTLPIGSNTIAHNIDNLEMCIYSAASVERSQYGRFMLPIASVDANWIAMLVGVNSNNMTFDIGRGIGEQLSNAFITLQYTKTTN